MVAVYNVVPGIAGAPAGIVIQPGNLPQINGAGQIGIQVFWIPGVQPAQQAANNFSLLNTIHNIAIGILSSIKAVFNDMNATSDFFSFMINLSEGLEKLDIHTRTLRIFANSFKTFTEFNSPRSFCNRFYSLVSWEAATQERLGTYPDVFRVVSKMLFLIKDGCQTIEWLHNIGYLSNEVVTKIGNFSILGWTPALSITSSFLTISASIPNLIDNSRLVWKYAFTREDTLLCERRFKCFSYSCDSLSDICRIAGKILSASPDPYLKLGGIAVSGFGSLIPLLKFAVDECTKKTRAIEKARVEARKAAAIALCIRQLELATLALNHATVSQQAINLLHVVMTELAQKPGKIQLQTDLALANEAMANAIAHAPIAPPLPLHMLAAPLPVPIAPPPALDAPAPEEIALPAPEAPHPMPEAPAPEAALLAPAVPPPILPVPAHQLQIALRYLQVPMPVAA